MRTLVTGAAGFVGPFLIDALRTRGHDVEAVVRRAPGSRMAKCATPIHIADVCDADAMGRVLAAARPQAIVHLAGLAITAAAEADPTEAYRINLGGTLGVLQAVRAQAPGARLLFVGSSEQYGATGERVAALDEDAPLEPTTVYAASKAAAELAAAQWGRAYDLDIVRVRAFNHTGPGQTPAFVCAGVARQLALIEAGRTEPILRVGRLDPVRDFSDVRDIVAGYVAVLETGAPGAVYNLCSGRGRSIAEVIDLLRSHARTPVEVRSDPARFRTGDVARIVGAHARATSALGWHPSRRFEDTLRDVLSDWRERIKNGEPG